MLVWRRRHASLSFQRAVTPTRLTSTKPTYTLRRQSLVTSLETVHPRAPPFRHPLSATLVRVSCPLLHTYTCRNTYPSFRVDSHGSVCVCVRCNKDVYVCMHTHRTHTHTHRRVPFRLPPPSRSTAQFPLTLIYLNYILRALACVCVCNVRRWHVDDVLANVESFSLPTRGIFEENTNA